MRQARYYQSQAGHERWLISYVDIVTILLILFVALAGRVPLQQAAEAASKPVAAQRPQPKPEPKDEALNQAAARLRADGLEAVEEQRGMVVRLPQALLYGSGEAGVRAEALPTLKRVADVLKSMPNQVLLVGHADASPLHGRRYKSNWELSAARSLRLLELLTTRYGVPEDRLLMAGRGAGESTKIERNRRRARSQPAR